MESGKEVASTSGDHVPDKIGVVNTLSVPKYPKERQCLILCETLQNEKLLW